MAFGNLNTFKEEAENAYLGDPLVWQRTGYDEGGIRTVLPPELRHTMSPEDEQAAYDADIKRQAAEVELEDRKLKQQADRDKLTYDKNVLTQGQSFLTEMKSLSPGDPDYALHRASLIERMPLAVEHNSVKYQLNNLDKTDEGLRQNKATVEEHTRQTGVTQKQQDLTKARDWAAQKGARYLQQFQETIRNNPEADPVSVIAQIVDAQEEQKSIAELRRHEIPKEEIDKFRIPEVNANGQPTGRTVFNKEAADDYLKTFPTTSNMNSLLSQRMKLREKIVYQADNKTIDTDQTPTDVLEDWDYINRLKARYDQKLGEGKTVQAEGSNATARPKTPKDFFKSKTTAPAEVEKTVESKPLNQYSDEDIQAAAEELHKKRKAKEASDAALKEQQTAQAAYNW